jgi:hypothetical protein
VVTATSTKREIAANPSLCLLLLCCRKTSIILPRLFWFTRQGIGDLPRPNKLSRALVHQVANILEDERIERQMCEEFAGVRWLVKRLSHALYEESKPIDEKSDSPGEVVAYFLQLRWAKRIGQPD